MSTAVASKGLEGIVAANSGICWIDGDAGVLAYRGIDIHDLAETSTFEETTYLLWHGKLPTATELEAFKQKLSDSRQLHPDILKLLKEFPKTATPMEVLRTAVSALSFYDKDEKAVDHDSNVRKSFDLTSQIATAIDEVLRPRGVAVLIEAEHTCMSIRGVAKPGASTVTTRFLGTFRDSAQDQLRFVTLARGAADVR